MLKLPVSIMEEVVRAECTLKTTLSVARKRMSAIRNVRKKKDNRNFTVICDIVSYFREGLLDFPLFSSSMQDWKTCPFTQIRDQILNLAQDIVTNLLPDSYEVLALSRQSAKKVVL